MTEKSTSRRPVFLALGSNLGDRMLYLQQAIGKLDDHQKIQVRQQSQVYESEPMYLTEQNQFLNMVVSVTTTLSPLKLLASAKSIEKDLGRDKRKKNGPRKIDIDIIFYADQVVDEPELKIPHPKMAERKFVLLPLNELAPGFVSPVLKKSVSQLLRECPDQSIIKPLNQVI